MGGAVGVVRVSIVLHYCTNALPRTLDGSMSGDGGPSVYIAMYCSSK
jgi:hypothetical protein